MTNMFVCFWPGKLAKRMVPRDSIFYAIYRICHFLFPMIFLKARLFNLEIIYTNRAIFDKVSRFLVEFKRIEDEAISSILF